jgi:Fic family protein
VSGQPNFTRHRIVRCEWSPDLASGGPRAARRPRSFDAYVPDPIADRDWSVPATLGETLAVAERRCTALEGHSAQVGLDTVARQLLRSESVASSRIEGHVLSHRRLAKAAVVPSHDVTARSVIGNIAAVERAYAWAQGSRPFELATFTDVHRVLFTGTRDEPMGGVIRSRQNWIGGDASSPANAEFVPPPADDVPRLVADLADFCNRTDLPPVLQAAIAHAHFETIHPFMDGNGRTGRALIGMVLLRRGVCRSVVPPVSLVLAGRADRYVRGLTSYRLTDPADWFAFFADAVAASAAASGDLAAAVGDLQEQWLRQAGTPRAGSAPRLIIQALPAHPVLTLATAVAITSLSDEACRIALNRLTDAGVLHETTAGKRNRVWESTGIFDRLDALERELGDPNRAPRATR